MADLAPGVGTGQFSVIQFFWDESYEVVLERVSAEMAVHRAKSLTESVGAQIGTSKRVIITDGGDCTAFEWQHGIGVVFPTREQCEAAHG